jgi:hypothetical protein
MVVGLFGQIGEHHAEVWNERLRRRVTLACDHNAGRAWTVAARSAATVHPHRKVERDTAIRREAFEDRWQAIEYIVVSPQLREDAETAGFTLILPALEHTETEAQFNSGG